MRWFVGPILLLLGFCLFSLAQELPVQVVDARGRTLTTLQVWLQRDDHYFQVSDLFRLFDTEGRKRYIPLTKRLTLQLRGRRFDFTVGARNASIDGQGIRLELPPLSRVEASPEKEATLWVPSEVITHHIGPALGYEVDFNPSAQRLQIRATSEAVPLSISSPGQVTPVDLIIDPGHGGQDSGVQTPTLLEKDVTLSVARQLLAHAQEKGLSAMLTRDADRGVPPLERARMALRYHGRVFLSLHCNASFSQDASGIRIYVNDVRGPLRPLDSQGESVGESAADPSREIQEVSQLRFRDESWRLAELLRTALEASSDAPITEVESVPLAPLQQVMMPAILVEIGFLTHPEDEARLTDRAAMQAFTEVVLSAVQQFLGGASEISSRANGN